jgi:hypothetical protein
MLLFVGWQIGADVAGTAGGMLIVAAYLAIEAVLFRTTRGRRLTLNPAGSAE